MLVEAYGREGCGPSIGGFNDHPEKPDDGQRAAGRRSWTVLCHRQ